MPTVIESIATGNPPARGSQKDAARFMRQVESLPERIRSRIPTIYERSGIDYRYSCVPDYVRQPEEFDFFPKTWSLHPPPSTAQRNARYREAVLPMAEKTAQRALDDAGLEPQEVTHIVAVSCTGFFAPGIDIELVRRLGLPDDTQRTMIGFMGCYAAFNGLRVADSFCRAYPDARVLLVCAELCTLHFQVDDSLESAIVNALFSDGAAAAVLAARPREEAKGRMGYVVGRSVLDEDSMDHMTWDVGDTGFLMGLSSRVPDVIARNLPAYVDELVAAGGVRRDEVDFWAIHPGGRAIVEKAQAVLDLDEEDVSDSLEVLRLHGNMSSPTILFVLKRFLDRHLALRDGGHDGFRSGVAMAFGPGLTLEGALLKQIT